MPDVLVHSIDTLLTMDPTCGEGRLGRLEQAAVHLVDGRVSWIGPTSEAPAAETTRDASGCLVMPALVDCHTHAVWAGSRAVEFEQRLAGRAYTEILEAGGGILSTVAATRGASEATLVADCASRLRRMACRGVGLVEIKGGYGLDPETEHRMLVAAKRAGQLAGVEVRTTFLGAHAVPEEWRSRRGAYVDHVIADQLPRVASVADFADVYVDRGAFTVEEGRRVLEASKAHGLRLRVHAEQVSFTGAAAMAAGLGALSADHLERIDEVGIAAMARAGTIAVLLPGAMLYLKDRSPPVAALREAGVPMAIATDLNPGSSPIDDLWVCATLAAVTMGVTVEEALLGITAVAADALGEPTWGRIRVGARGAIVVARPPAGEPAEPAVFIQHLGAPIEVERI